jgi:NAD(P)-dependent dehydrogenase (short-subunit alcohol dehydrogenase family)
MTSPFSVSGAVAVVTGASSGLGNRFARVLHDAGATVVVGARRLDRLEALCDELGNRIVPVECDVAVDSDCEKLIAAAGDRIDILVNNAGIGNVAPPGEEESVNDFRRVIEVNLNAVYLLSQLASRGMLRQGHGSIINISSILGLVASAPIRQASYTASKAAVINLTRELACQWARSGVRVNAIAPGWFRSEMTANELFDDEASMRFVRRNTPMGRGGEAHELDGVLLFLASPASSFVTGVTIPVDGGWTAR